MPLGGLEKGWPGRLVYNILIGIRRWRISFLNRVYLVSGLCDLSCWGNWFLGNYVVIGFWYGISYGMARHGWYNAWTVICKGRLEQCCGGKVLWFISISLSFFTSFLLVFLFLVCGKHLFITFLVLRVKSHL